jgi:polyhydroxybutyrate depolymerase
MDARRLLACAVATAVLAACGSTQESGSRTVTVELADRPFRLHIPAAYDDEDSAALVVLLHGYRSSGAEQESYFQLTPESERHGFLYAMPDGTTAANGNRFWNASPACCDFDGTGVDDSTYLSELITTVEAQYTVNRVYLVGHSNGGFMAYRMACDHADQITAIVSLAGAATGCTPARPVSVLQIHGTDDRVIAYAGGANGGQPYPSVDASLAQWRRIDGCGDQNEQPGPMNLDAEVPGAETTVTTYTCAAGTRVELWSVAGGSHVPGLTGEFATAVTDFLERT